jgi:hypothetical protein
MLTLLLKIWKKEGLSGFYNGFAANMLNTFSMREWAFVAAVDWSSGPTDSAVFHGTAEFAYFYFHTFLVGVSKSVSIFHKTAFLHLHLSQRTLTLRRLSRRALKPVTQLSTAAELLLGALAGALAQIFTIPVAVIATRQQLYEKQDDKPAPTLMETANEIIDEDGIAGLWTGLKPGLVLTVNPAITYGVFERVKGVVVAANGGHEFYRLEWHF